MGELNGTRVLVTGAGGFIGRWLVEALLERHAEVVGIDIAWRWPRPLERGLMTLTHDVRDGERMKQIVATVEPEVIYHLAALSQVTEVSRLPTLAFDTNAGGTVAVLEAVRTIRPDTFVVVSTSDKVYGPLGATEQAMDERRCLAPVHPYDAAKASADLMAQCYAEFYGLSVRVVRLCNVYAGDDDNYKRLIPGVMRDVALGRQPVIRSDGGNVREYLYIKDAVDGLLRAGSTLVDGVWNMGGYPLSAMGVYRAIMAEMQSRGFAVQEPNILNEAQDETAAIRLDSSKALRDLNWSPKTSIPDGLGQTASMLLALMKDGR